MVAIKNWDNKESDLEQNLEYGRAHISRVNKSDRVKIDFDDMLQFFDAYFPALLEHNGDVLEASFSNFLAKY